MNDIRYLVLHLTQDCNFSCIYCYAGERKPGRHMDLDLAKKALSLPKGDFTLQLTGGEVFMNPGLFFDLMDFLQRNRGNRKIKIQLQTNASLIDPAIAKRLKPMKIGIGVSLDGSVEVNEYQRGHTVQTMEGIQNLGQEGMAVNLNAVVTDQSVKRLWELVDMAFYLGNVRGIGLDLLRKTGRGKDIAMASPSDIRNSLKRMHERVQEIQALTGRKMALREIEEAKIRLQRTSGSYCYAAQGRAAVVLPTGEVFPCGSLAGDPQYRMGNLADSLSLQMISLNSPMSNECQSCEYGTFCAGACPARSMVNGDDPSVRYTKEDCSLKKAAFEIAIKELSHART